MPEQEVDAVETQAEDTQQDVGFFSDAVAAINEEQESAVETQGEQEVDENDQPEQHSEVSEQSQDSPEAEEPADVATEEEGETEEVEASEETETEDIPDKENPDRFQYWQSKAQKYENQYGDLDGDTVDLAKNIRQNPDILKAVEQAINGETPTQPSPSAEQQEQEQAELSRPERPTKPSDYNRMDAVSDPDSESAKYEQALVEYQEDLTDYMEAKDRRKEQRRKKKQQSKKQQRAIQEQKEQIATELQQGYGYSDEQAQDFLQYLDNQPNNLDSYRKLYEAEKGIGDYAKPKQPPQNKPRSQKKKQKSKSNPPPAGIGGSAPADTSNEGGFFG